MLDGEQLGLRHLVGSLDVDPVQAMPSEIGDDLNLGRYVGRNINSFLFVAG
jgi:hypothetical protein